MKGEDVVVMAQALEKLYRSKVAQMPKDEIKIETASTKIIKKKPKTPQGTLVATPSATPVSANKIPPPKSSSSSSSTLPPNSISSSNAQVSTMLPSTESSSAIIPGSTNKPTAVNAAATNVQPTPITPATPQSNLHNLIMSQPTNNSQMPTSSGTSSFLVNQPMINTVSIPSQQPAKVKKGVKRKADTTTPTSSFNDSGYPSADTKVSTRGRQVSHIKIIIIIIFLFILAIILKCV